MTTTTDRRPLVLAGADPAPRRAEDKATRPFAEAEPLRDGRSQVAAVLSTPSPDAPGISNGMRNDPLLVDHETPGRPGPVRQKQDCGEIKTQALAASLRLSPILNLLTWLSPSFPTGAFAYSHALEWAVEARDITDEPTLQSWLADLLAHGTPRTDTILLRHAHRAAHAPETLAALAALATATAASRERQSEALNQGEAFLLAAAPWGTPPLPPRTPYAITVGATAGFHRIPEDAAAAAALQAFAANLISAAVRLVPLGQTAGLRTLAALEPLILQTAEETKSATLDDLGGACFRSDLAAMRHETQYTRLFRS